MIHNHSWNRLKSINWWNPNSESGKTIASQYEISDKKSNFEY